LSIPGITSDEIVSINVAESERSPLTELYGFNDESPFFTAGHVFYTATGLRAIDPSIAEVENDWLQVGHLRAEDRVFRLKSKNDSLSHYGPYDLVTIKSIKSGFASSSHVYGVHLREGLRSYHANGYLVGMNYPEVTTHRISSKMSGMHFHKLKSYTALLANSHETIAAALGSNIAHVVKDKVHRGHPMNPGREQQKPHAKRLKESSNCSFRPLDLIRTFKLIKQLPANVAKDHQGATSTTLLEVVNGLVVIDGELCERSDISRDEIRWSRYTDEREYEHGAVRLGKFGFAKFGALALSNDAELESIHSVQAVPLAAEPGMDNFKVILGVDKIAQTAIDTYKDLAAAITRLQYPNDPPIIGSPGWMSSCWSINLGTEDSSGASMTTAAIPELDALLQMIKDGTNMARKAAITDKDGNIRPNLIYTSTAYSKGNVLACDIDLRMDWNAIELLRQQQSQVDKTTYIPTPPHLQFQSIHIENADYVTIQGWYTVDPAAQIEFPKANRYTYGMISSVDSTTSQLHTATLRKYNKTLEENQDAILGVVNRVNFHTSPAIVTKDLADEGVDLSLTQLLHLSWPTSDDIVHQGCQTEILNAV